MSCRIPPILFVLASASAALADDGPGRSSPAVEERYRALIEEHREVLREEERAFAAAGTRAEKLAASEVDRVSGLAGRFLALAAEAPDDPLAFEALRWVALNGRPGPAWSRAMGILAARHAREPGIAEVFSRLEFNPRPEPETLLRAVLDGEADRTTKGRACLTLARRHLKASEFAREGESRTAESLDILRKLFGTEAVDSLLRADPEPLRREAVADFDRAIREFGDVLSGDSTLGELARRESFAARSLNVGQVAPDIDGVDGDGVRFKLSDYRGKSVLLVFCGDWCPPCRAAYPHERALGRALEGKPFALLIVDTDEDKAKVKATMAEKRVPARCWLDGAPGGPIVSTWNVAGFPTAYVLDAGGVIRYKALGYRREEIARALGQSLREAGHAVPLENLADVP